MNLLRSEPTESVGYDLGRQYAEYPARFIPRRVWVAKPEFLGLRIRSAFWGDRLTGIPPTPLGEGYLAAGWTGVLAVGALIGLALGIVQKRLLARQAHVALGAVLALEISVRAVRSGLEISHLTISVAVIVWLVLANLRRRRQMRVEESGSGGLRPSSHARRHERGYNAVVSP